MKKLIIAALGVALGAASLNASAADQTILAGGLGVNLTLTSACAVTLDTAISFTTVPTNRTGSHVSSPGVLHVDGCGLVYKLAADIGSHPSGGGRTMVDAASGVIPYALSIQSMTPAGATQAWGDTGILTNGNTIAASAFSQAAGTGADVYNVVATAALTGTPLTEAAGLYSDTVVVTVEF